MTWVRLIVVSVAFAVFAAGLAVYLQNRQTAVLRHPTAAEQTPASGSRNGRSVAWATLRERLRLVSSRRTWLFTAHAK